MFARRTLMLWAILLRVVSSAHAFDGGGVNMYLQRVWWHASPPGYDNYADLSQENRERIGVAAAEGFKLVRIMFQMSLVRPEAPEDAKGQTLRLMSELVSEANRKGMRAIVTLTGDETSNKLQLICRQQEVLERSLTAVATALPDNPSAGLETLNEPPDGCGPLGSPGSWPVLQERLYREIRALRPHISIIVAGGGWGTLDGLVKFDPKPYINDTNVLFSFHYYEPFLFTSQSSSMIYPGCYKYVHDLGWPYDSAFMAEVEGKAMRQFADDRTIDGVKRDNCRRQVTADLIQYKETGTLDFARSRFDLAASWARKNGIAAGRVFLGEFGVVRPQQKMAGNVLPGAARWLQAIAHAAKERHFLWAMFDFDTTYAINCGQPPIEKICDEYIPALE